jgi:acetyl esterase/lipase
MPIPLTLQVAWSALSRPRTVAYGENRNQVAELHLPAGSGPFPVAVLLHGGYWQTRYGKLTCRPLAARLRRSGYAVWNLEYRRVGPGRNGGGGWPGTFLDVANGIDALRGRPGVRLDDVTLVGHSAGGQLALWAALRDRLPEDALGGRPRVSATRVIALSPVVDLAEAGERATTLLGGSAEREPERWHQADPTRAGAPSQPTLIVHPTDDAAIPVARSRAYVDACRAAGADVTLAEPPGEGHRDVISPTSRSWQAAEEWLTSRTTDPSGQPPAR